VACSWNKSFTPTLVSQDADTFPANYCYDKDWNSMRPNQAVGCVDFCDALAYCEWAGKRLCGEVGKGANGVDTFTGTVNGAETFLQTVARSPQSEFMNACTQGGKTTYPYGSTYESDVCIDPTWVQQHGATALDVTDTTSRQCHGSIAPFNGVYDLSGSVDEWQNMCFKQDTAGEGCVTSGSGWQDTKSCTGNVAFESIQSVVIGTGFPLLR
jgi:formylglycine-generating enzyme required for sulfatase activity